MNYQQIQPPDCLKNYIRYFWVLESTALKTFRPIADGCPGLIFQPSEKSTFYDQDHKQLPSLFLYGQTIQHRAIHIDGCFSATGVSFYPHALRSVFGFDADELTDACVNINALTTQLGKFLAEQLVNAPSVTDQIEQLSTYLFAQIGEKSRQPDNLMQWALTQIIESKGTISQKELQQKLRLTERSLERRFKQTVGISPKVFSRICRFQASLSQLKRTQYAKLSDVAFDNGYADQSHFIRVFKEFVGAAPDQYRKKSDELIGNLPEWL